MVQLDLVPGSVALEAMMLPRIQTDIIRAATLAPSPDNNQPWRFAFQGNRLNVYLDHARTLTSDVKSMFSLLAIGAAVENACIAARQAGFDSRVRCDFDEAASASHTANRIVAEIGFIPGGSPDPLFPFLGERCTCRKPYEVRKVRPELLNQLADAGAERNCQLDWIENPADIASVSRIVAATDRIRLEYPGFHQEIYRQLRFSPRDADQSRDGLDIRTLALPPGSGLFLRFLRSWNRMRLLNRMGLSRILARQSAAVVRQSSAIGVLSMPTASAETFLNGGQSLQRVWLTAQRHGLALHPLGSLPIFLAHEELLEGRDLNEIHRRIVASLGTRVRSLVPQLGGRMPVMLFRLGYAGSPAVRSLRRSIEDVGA